MPIKTVYGANVEHLQIMDEHGVVDKELATNADGTPVLKDEEILELYVYMCKCRALDETAFKLQRSGRMGTYPQNKGQEAAAIGSAYALERGSDWLVPCYRENAALWMHGLPMHYVLLHWMGDERGIRFRPGSARRPCAFPSAPSPCTRWVFRGRSRCAARRSWRLRTLAMAQPAKATCMRR